MKPSSVETLSASLILPETPCRKTLNPKVQGSIPCASTNMLYLRRLYDYMLWLGCRSASPLRHLTASFDSFIVSP